MVEKSGGEVSEGSERKDREASSYRGAGEEGSREWEFGAGGESGRVVRAVLSVISS